MGSGVGTALGVGAALGEAVPFAAAGVLLAAGGGVGPSTAGPAEDGTGRGVSARSWAAA